MYDEISFSSDIHNVPTRFKEIGQVISITGPTPYSRDVGEYLYYSVKDNKYPYIEFDYNLVKPEYRYNLKKFFLALDSYHESGVGIFNPDEILRNSLLLGPVYTKDMKDSRFQSFVDHVGGKTLSESDPAIYKKPVLGDISGFFNFRYLFFWTEETDSFMEYSFLPLVGKKSRLNLFKEFLKKDLPEIESFPDAREILLKSSASSSLCNGKLSKGFITKTSTKSMGFARSIGKTKLVHIMKSPGEPREILILEIDALNTIQRFEQVSRTILSHYEENMMIKNKKLFLKKIDDFAEQGEDDSFYYYRDVKKDGLTKPRFLLKVLIEAIEEKYDLKLPVDFFEELEVEYEKESYRPLRGHGLGTANGLTTLLYILLARFITTNPVNSENQIEGSFLCLNDDFVGKFSTEEELESYIEEEDLLYQDFDLILSKEKCFSSTLGFLFCEEYLKGFRMRKSVTDILTAYQPLLGVNIAHAKMLSASLNPSTETVNKYISYWGFEFCPQEAYLPHTLGGWKSPLERGIDVSLMDLDYQPVINRLFEASLVKVSKRDKYTKKINKFNLLAPSYLISLGVSQDHLLEIGVKTLQQWSQSSSIKNPNLLNRYFWDLYEKRHQAFRKAKLSVIYENFVFSYNNAYKNVFPVGPLISGWANIDSDDGVFPMINITSENPILNYLCFKGYIRPTAQVLPEPLSLLRSPDSTEKNLSAGMRNTFSYYNTMEDIFIPHNIPNWLIESYENPFLIAAIAYKKLGKFPIPIETGKFKENLRLSRCVNEYIRLEEPHILVFCLFLLSDNLLDNADYLLDAIEVLNKDYIKEEEEVNDVNLLSQQSLEELMCNTLNFSKMPEFLNTTQFKALSTNFSFEEYNISEEEIEHVPEPIEDEVYEKAIEESLENDPLCEDEEELGEEIPPRTYDELTTDEQQEFDRLNLHQESEFQYFEPEERALFFLCSGDKTKYLRTKFNLTVDEAERLVNVEVKNPDLIPNLDDDNNFFSWDDFG